MLHIIFTIILEDLNYKIFGNKNKVLDERVEVRRREEINYY